MRFFKKIFTFRKKEAVLRAKIIRANGTVEDLGEIAKVKKIKNKVEVKNG